MSEKVLVLSADGWSMADEKTGVINNGISVWYVNDYREDTAGAVGFKPTKVSCTAAVFDKMRVAGVPGVFEVDFKTRPGAQGKPTLTLVNVTPIRPVPLDALFAEGQRQAARPEAKAA